MVRQDEEGVLSYYKQTALGVQLRTNGYGVFYELGRMKTPRTSNIYTLELVETKHPKEERFGSPEGFFGNSYIYGKTTNFYQANLGIGKQYIFGQKGNKNGIAVIGSVQGGLSMGLLKPYMLDVENNAGERVQIKYEQDTVNFLDPFAIYGSSGFAKGWDDLDFNPGLYVKTSLRFDFGRFNESISALEIGISANGYAKEIQQMALVDPRRIFYQGHIAFIFGRRK